MNHGLKPAHFEAILEVLRKNPRVERVLLFGSRAMGTFTKESDIDLCLVGDKLTLTDKAELLAELEKLPVPQTVDLVLERKIEAPTFLEHVRKKGKIVFERSRGGSGRGGWREVRVGDVARIKHGFAFDGTHFVDEPTEDVLVTPGNFEIGGGFKLDKLKYYRGPVPDDYVLSAGDVVVTMTDLSKASDTLGYSALVPRRSDLRFLHNQRIGKLGITRPDLVDKDFLYWLFRTPDYRTEVLAGATGTTVKHTAPGRIEAFRFNVPPLPEQRAIAHILGTLDDKIELNRKMNETLEAMARALFKSWFVDFDPVRAKAEGRQPSGMDAETAKLFPSEFVESELGPIPKGWRAGRLEELAGPGSSAITAGPFGSNLVRSDYVVSGVPVIRGQNLGNRPGEWFVEDKFVYVSPEKVDRDLSTCTARRGDVLFTQRGTLGQVGMIPFDAKFDRYIVSQSQMKMTCAPGVPAEYVVVYFKQPETISYVKSNAVAAGVPHINLGFLRRFPILLPSEAVLRTFGGLVRAIQMGMRCNVQESRCLATLRDSLLPRLLSGEISVTDAERCMEATG